MKTFMKTLALVLTFGVAALAFAGNKPALTYPEGQSAITSGTVDVTPWNKGALVYAGGTVVPVLGYNYCPAAGPNRTFTAKHPGVQVALSNGKRIMLCCTPCKDDVEKDLTKFVAFMY